MKKGLLFAAVLCSSGLLAQQYTHQVLIANEGFFDFQTNAILEPATIGSYDPISQTYTVVDTLEGQRFSSDVVIDGNVYFVAADTKIFKYDLNTHQALGSISLPGVRNLAVAGNKLIATRGEYLQTYDSYLSVFDKNTLQLLVAFDTIQGPKWATQNVVVVNNIAYIAVNNAYEWGNEKGIIGQLNLNTLSYGSEIDLGPEGKNPDNLFVFNNALYSVNNKDWSGTSISKIDFNGSVNTQNISNATTGCGTSALREDKLIYQISLENTLNDYNLLDMSTVGPVAGISMNFYELSYNAIENLLYTSTTDFFSQGAVQIFDANNALTHQFNVGVSPGTIVFDIRSSANLLESKSNLSIFPNPSHGVFNLNGLDQSTTYTVHNAAGQEILRANASTLDLNEFNSGIYFLQYGSTCYKLVKN